MKHFSENQHIEIVKNYLIYSILIELKLLSMKNFDTFCDICSLNFILCRNGMNMKYAGHKARFASDTILIQSEVETQWGLFRSEG